jgi:hypothetical protein
VAGVREGVSTGVGVRSPEPMPGRMAELFPKAALLG